MPVSPIRVAYRHLTRRKTASWAGSGPLDGDTPMDLLLDVQRLDPRKAGNRIEKELKSREFTHAYSAMGVWDVVMSSGVQAYMDVFEYLSPVVAAVARKGIPRNDEWSDDVEVWDWLKKYKMGKPTGKIRGHQFRPTGLKGAIWYIDKVWAGGDPIDVSVELRNQYTNEVTVLEEMVGPPDTMDLETVDAENYGGTGSEQQSIVINAYDDDGNQWQMQWEIDTKTGEWSPHNDRAQWEGPS